MEEQLLKEETTWAENFFQIANKSQSLFKKVLEKRLSPSSIFQLIHFNQIYQKFLQHLTASPEQLISFQCLYWQELFFIWQRFLSDDQRNEKIDDTPIQDKRFHDPAWQNNPVFYFIKHFYFLHVQHFQGLLNMAEGLDNKTIQQIQFYLKQLSEAISPDNFATTNPEVWRATLEKNGQNLLQGLDNALIDLEKDDDIFQIKMTDTTAFTVGKNLALTAGKVIYQNKIMQLIQYTPQTTTVYQRPFLFIPPWINKYYILDLNPSLSLTQWLVQQGYTVFMISWVNPTQQHANKDFSDYMLEGPLQALDIIEKATGEVEINALGYCVGGTLLSCALAYLAYQNNNRIHSATYLCSLLDFSAPGELGAFIDEKQLQFLENEMQQKGYLSGQHMATTFNLLRPHDLIWSYYIKNYLLGQNPSPHDILYWNNDSTNLPEKMHIFYLRNMYLNNRLMKNNSLTLNNVPINLQRITIPTYFIATIQDHIAPWKSVYAGLKLHSGPVNFILGGSGHIAGAINPPEKNKYNYYQNNNTPDDPETWFKQATEQPGSWWPTWEKWLQTQSGISVTARTPGDTGLPLIEDAPGTYVKKKLKIPKTKKRKPHANPKN